MTDPTRWPLHEGGETCEEQDVYEVKTMTGVVVTRHYVCQHNATTPVVTGGEHVASICLTCDQQLPPRNQEDA